MTGPAHPSVTTLLTDISVLPLLMQSTGEVRHPLWCLSGVQSHSCCHAAFFFRGVEHKVTTDRSVTRSSLLSIGTCVVCGQSCSAESSGERRWRGEREWDQEQECCCHCPPPELSSKGQTVQLQPLCQTQSYFRGTIAQSRQRSRNGSTMI